MKLFKGFVIGCVIGVFVYFMRGWYQWLDNGSIMSLAPTIGSLIIGFGVGIILPAIIIVVSAALIYAVLVKWT